jgi:hypothetical protein
VKLAYGTALRMIELIRALTPWATLVIFDVRSSGSNKPIFAALVRMSHYVPLASNGDIGRAFCSKEA